MNISAILLKAAEDQLAKCETMHLINFLIKA